MPSLPVRGFGEDGLLVTGGVGASEAAEFQTIVGRGAQFGLLGVQSGVAGLLIVPVADGGALLVSPPPVPTTEARGAQTGLLGSQRGAAYVLPGVNYLTALCDLDEDLAWAA